MNNYDAICVCSKVRTYSGLKENDLQKGMALLGGVALLEKIVTVGWALTSLVQALLSGILRPFPVACKMQDSQLLLLHMAMLPTTDWASEL